MTEICHALFAPQQDRQSQRRLAVLRHADEVTGNVSLTCRYYGSAATGSYKWQRRHEGEGLAGRSDRSSAPHLIGGEATPKVCGVSVAMLPA